ncbi:NADH-quinone oxidoreductase subunit H [Desulforhopalus vacuolatus]|uniref:complex I subunit 1/NuoH family protein n=1 Tax=Desulforhopalus vacuolatus TaxID=40414 RepID=UPI0019660C1F|nr:complex I subunit 1 family protein [Desulforhopalus vacuolatus]MBM9518672.1 NADH-quinone oxidoreductase subunit H [Desulforhopalus vacuolatus]
MILTLTILLAVIIAIAWAAFNAAYLVLAERRGAGIIQRRPGPNINGPFGLLQPPLDGIKLMAKQLIIPDGADKFMYISAPVLVMCPAIMSFVALPYSDWLQAQNIDVGLLMVFAFASMGTMGIVFAGWSSRNKYSLMAAMRSVSQAVAYEIPMIITALTITLMAGTTNLDAIVAQQSENFFHWNIFPLFGETHNILMPFSFLIFFICSMAETNRAPFDLGEAEGELVAGFHIEYGSMGFGLFFMGEYANIVIGATLATIFFLGGWSCPFGLFPGVWWFLIKMYAIIFTIIWIRWTFPRTTIYGLLNLSWKILIPASLVNLLLTAGLMKVF